MRTVSLLANTKSGDWLQAPLHYRKYNLTSYNQVAIITRVIHAILNSVKGICLVLPVENRKKLIISL